MMQHNSPSGGIACRAFLLMILLTAGSATAPAQQPGGSVSGIVFDANTGTPVRGADVIIEGPSQVQTKTDLDGAYQVNLPPGVYVVKISAPKYLPTEIEGLIINSGEASDGSVVLGIEGATTTIDVTATIQSEAATAASMLIERKLASTVSDSISGVEIGKSTASDAAGALEKVTGVSIAPEGFVYVRGLNERYSATMLNNALVPTTDPEKRVVPLDLFPAKLIDRIKVIKTYSPDLPGEFAGGLVQMSTVEFPRQKMFAVSGSVGLNSRTTFQKFQSYAGGGQDVFGFDDGSRELPGIIPEERLFRGSFSTDEFQQFGRAFSNDWESDFRDSMRPTQSYSIVAGDSFGKLGVVGAVTFTNAPQQLSEVFRLYVNEGAGSQRLWTGYDNFLADTESARLGGVLNLAYHFTPAHKLVWRNTLTHDSDKEARTFSGFNGGSDDILSSERLRWIERGIFSTQLEGEHVLSGVGNSILTWQLGYARSNRTEPDLREVIRIGRADGQFAFFSSSPEGATRFYSDMAETIYEPSIDFMVPFYKGPFSGSLKLGVRSTVRDRDFESRRFRFALVRPGIDLTLPSNQLFAPENISPNGFEVREVTRGTDSYTAGMNIHAGYAMLDVSLGGRWRVIGGLRVEDADELAVSIDPFNPAAVPAIAALTNRDPLPAINAVYSLGPKQNLRFAYGKTVSRPDFRELSPFGFTNVLGGFATVGNPNLVRATIQNYDARWEWFLGADQILAASYFYKHFNDPIEVVFEPGITSRQTWANADSSRNQGIELEFRRNLAFAGEAFRPFSVQSNFTFVDSNVQIPEDIRTTVTNLERPLLGQSRYVFNGAIEWFEPRYRSTARLYLNYVSRRITNVGIFGLQDIYQEGNTLIDFVYEYSLSEKRDWKLKFSAENLADNEFRWTQGGETHRLFKLGRTYQIGMSYSLF